MSQLRNRISISSLFFIQGLVFSSWAVRIPSIQEMHSVSEGGIGTILMMRPIAAITAMPFSAGAVERFGSRKVLLFALFLYGLVFVGLGLMPTVPLLMANLFLFSFIGNFVNIAVNTQGIDLERHSNKSLLGSLHALWSLAGFVGGGLGALMIAGDIVPWKHFLIVLGLIYGGAFLAAPNLLPDTLVKSPVKRKFLQFPDKALLVLGCIAFFSLLFEGSMFDWTGIYFKKVVGAEGGWIGAGYTAFMVTMGIARFSSDFIRDRLGTKRTLLFSGVLMFTGLSLAVAFPTLEIALVGLLLVGAGCSSVIPVVYSLAGKSSTLPSSVALTAVATTGYFGFLIGPPLVGYVAEATDLRVSFMLIACMGLVIAFLSSRFGRKSDNELRVL